MPLEEEAVVSLSVEIAAVVVVFAAREDAEEVDIEVGVLKESKDFAIGVGMDVGREVEVVTLDEDVVDVVDVGVGSAVEVVVVEVGSGE